MKLKSLLFFLLIVLGSETCLAQKMDDNQINEVLVDAQKANEALYRSHRFVEGWLKQCDPKTGLIPRNLRGDNYWNAQDAAADNYPFMVLTAFFTDEGLYKGKMLDMLKSEIKYTARMGACPATYDFDKQAFRDSIVDVGNVIFGSAEYVKDGLLPLTEWLGQSPWSDRMLNILNDLHTRTNVVTKIEGDYLGGMQEVEVNGDLLQALSRVYWMTGKKEYLDWAIEIGDYYLLKPENSLLTYPKLRLRDHGGEIILGLCELYATVHFAQPEKQKAYKESLYRTLDRVLECGRNEHGMFYDEINPQDCSIVSAHLADTWGYILDGFYTVYMVDNYEPYREATLKALRNLYDHYRNYDWENGSQDGYADSVESAINLYNREPMPEVAKWIDSEIQIMLNKQKPDGIIEGWHGDGNYARTAIMYVLWKSQGAYVKDWNKNLLLGAQKTDDTYCFVVKSKEQAWKGKIHFDKPRHKMNLILPIDWARINQFPEWFAPEPDVLYRVSIDGKEFKQIKGSELHQGLPVSLKRDEIKTILIQDNRTQTQVQL